MAYLCYGDSVQGNVIDNLRAGWVADLVRWVCFCGGQLGSSLSCRARCTVLIGGCCHDCSCRLLLAVDLLFTFALFMYPVSEVRSGVGVAVSTWPLLTVLSCAVLLQSFERVLFDESSFGQRRTELGTAFPVDLWCSRARSHSVFRVPFPAGRNAFRAFIVLLTAAVAVLIPHFSLITGPSVRPPFSFL